MSEEICVPVADEMKAYIHLFPPEFRETAQSNPYHCINGRKATLGSFHARNEIPDNEEI